MYVAYILWSIWLALLAFAVVVIASQTAPISPWLAAVIAIPLTIVAMLWTVRLLMVFPMISLNEGMGWSRAWRMTKGNGWRLLIGLGLCFLLTVVVVLIIGLPAKFLLAGLATGTTVPLLIDTAIQQILTVLFLMVFLGSMAEAYRQLRGPGTAVSEDVLSEFDD